MSSSYGKGNNTFKRSTVCRHFGVFGTQTEIWLPNMPTSCTALSSATVAIHSNRYQILAAIEIVYELAVVTGAGEGGRRMDGGSVVWQLEIAERNGFAPHNP